MEWLRVVERDGLDAIEGNGFNAIEGNSGAREDGTVYWTREQLWKMTCLNGTFLERREQWKRMKGSLDMRGGRVWLVGCGAYGTVILYVLMQIMENAGFVVFDKRAERREAAYDVAQWSDMPMEFRHVLVDEENYRNVLGDVARGDLVVDCSVGVDTVAAIELCMERGAMFINSAIEDWMPDGFYEPESEMEESMLFLHGRLRRIGGKESSALVSMGCNPGSVSVWCKLGLEFVAASRWPLKEWKSYGEMARLLGLETVHVSECDTYEMGEKRPLGEYWNTWSSDSAAFYKEGVGPAETGWGSHESNDWNEGDFVRGGADEWNFRVWRAPGLCMEAETVLPMAGRVRGMVVRHDESFTIARALSDEASRYSPSVYYVYRPSDAAMESVAELKEQRRAPDSWRLMSEGIVEGRDEVGLSMFFRGGAGLWVGSELDIGEARALYEHRVDRWVNATINYVVGGYVAGIAWLLANRRAGVVDPEVVPAAFGLRWGGPFWGPVVVMPFESPFRSNRIEDMGLSRSECYLKASRD